MPSNKPVPTPSPLTRVFWEGTRVGKLMLPSCCDCGRVHWYPRYICPFCHSMALEWIEGSGEGTIYTYAVQHRAFGGWAEEVPFVTAYIDLDEGDRMVTVLRGVDPNKPESIQIGARVKVEFDDYSSLDKGDGIFVPYFRVKGEAS
jgi:uncharacterized OB-fold protein